jgi:hypothetical protein
MGAFEVVSLFLPFPFDFFVVVVIGVVVVTGATKKETPKRYHIPCIFH